MDSDDEAQRIQSTQPSERSAAVELQTSLKHAREAEQRLRAKGKQRMKVLEARYIAIEKLEQECRNRPRPIELLE